MTENALQVVKYDENLFENIKHVNEYGQEFWYARELQPLLEYSQWRYLKEAIERAKTACANSGHDVEDHFAEVRKMVEIGSGAKRNVEDYELSRYACYLIVMNGDPRKEVIALGQTYFAVKTRQQELIEDYEKLTEEQKRLAIRNEMKRHCKSSDCSSWREGTYNDKLNHTWDFLKVKDNHSKSHQDVEHRHDRNCL